MSFSVTIGGGSAVLPPVVGALALVSGPGPVTVTAAAPASSTPTSAGPNGSVVVASGTLTVGGAAVVIPGPSSGPAYAPSAITSEGSNAVFVPGTPPDPRMVGAADPQNVPWPVHYTPPPPTPPTGTTSIGSATITIAGAPGSYAFTVNGQ